MLAQPETPGTAGNADLATVLRELPEPQPRRLRLGALSAAVVSADRVFTPSPWHLHQTVITTACTGADSIGS